MVSVRGVTAGSSRRSSSSSLKSHFFPCDLGRALHEVNLEQVNPSISESYRNHAGSWLRVRLPCDHLNDCSGRQNQGGSGTGIAFRNSHCLPSEFVRLTKHDRGLVLHEIDESQSCLRLDEYSDKSDAKHAFLLRAIDDDLSCPVRYWQLRHGCAAACFTAGSVK